jgi:iduronate 2-sulfatase
MSWINRSWYTLLLLALLSAGNPAPTRSTQAPPRLNVLLIAVDDLRPELRCYGSPIVQSPNIDSLARRGVIFTRAYCQQAVCTPSRTSVLTGLRPDSTKVYNLRTHFRETTSNVITLPQYFKHQGYHTQSFGKVYHGGRMDDPQSWSAGSRQGEHEAGEGVSWAAPEVADNALGDGKIADLAIEALRQIKDKPFFLGVGFRKPHLPFIAPRKYYDLYPPGRITRTANPFSPKDVPSIALTDWGELRQYKDIPPAGPLSDEMARALVRGYYAATTYMDAQVGRVLAELDRLGLRNKTIIVLWGDHGFQLGEHGLWCKHTNFEVATRSPLIFSAPGQKNTGSRSEALVELVDIYPTLCELAGLPIPSGLEGTSLSLLLESPRRPWKQAAFSQYPRGKVMGSSMRTERYRYTEWAEPGQAPVRIELYDHRSDPAENVNAADLPENKKLVTELSGKLRAGWRAALPSGIAHR